MPAESVSANWKGWLPFPLTGNGEDWMGELIGRGADLIQAVKDARVAF
jgi:hypothetical protein